MQQQGNTALAAMFANPGALTVTSTATPGGVSKDVTAFASEFVVTRELAGDLPDSVSLVGGAVSASVRIKADGKMPTAPHPLKAADRAAWLGAQVDLAAGYDGVTVPVFSGRLREFGFDESAYALTMSLMENADRMRAAVTVATYGSRVKRWLPQKLVRSPTNAAALVVAALHASGIRYTPAQRANCVAAVPLAFGQIAEVGWTHPQGDTAPGAAWLTPGRFGYMPTGTGFLAFPSRAAFWVADAVLQGESWYYHTPGVAGESPRIMVGLGAFKVNIDAAGAYWLQSSKFTPGGVWSGYGYDAGRNLTAGWQHLAWEFNWAGNYRLWRNGVLVSSGNAGSWASTSRPDIATAVYLSASTGRYQGVNLYHAASGTLSAPAPGVATFTPEADVDPALLDLDTVPPIDGRVAWELCKEIAAAELGMVGFSETGRFYFRNRDSVNGSTAPVATFSTDLVENLTGSASIDSVRTRVVATVPRLWLTESGLGADSEATTAVPSFLAGGVPFTVPPGNSSHLLQGDRAFMPWTGNVSVITAPGAAWDSGVGIAVCTDAAGTTRWTGTGVGGSIHPIGPSTWRLDLVNETGTTLYTAWPAAWTSPTYAGVVPFDMQAGRCAVWVNGYSLGNPDTFTAETVNRVNTAALAIWGDRTFELEESDWRQDPAGVQALADKLLLDLVQPRAQLGEITVPADLRLQIGDPVQLTDWQGRLPSVPARVTRIVTTIGREVENGMTHKLDLRTLVGA